MWNLLYLLLIPVILFGGTVLLTFVFDKTSQYDQEWWAMPLYMAINFPVALVTILGVVAAIAGAAGAFDVQG